jgi:hypothetical protein
VIRVKIEGKMHRRTVWPGSTFWLICYLWLVLCQTGFSQEPDQKAPDPLTYLAFLRQVTALKPASSPILLNGEATNLRHLTVQEATGLTDQETEILNAVAADCEARISRIDETVRTLTFEARLRSLQSEGASEWLAQRLRDLDKQRDDIIRDQIRQLEAELGASRFEVLDAYVRSKKSAASFFLPVPPRGFPVLRFRR